jgi:hypothetical protein
VKEPDRTSFVKGIEEESIGSRRGDKQNTSIFRKEN